MFQGRRGLLLQLALFVGLIWVLIYVWSRPLARLFPQEIGELRSPDNRMRVLLYRTETWEGGGLFRYRTVLEERGNPHSRTIAECKAAEAPKLLKWQGNRTFVVQVNPKLLVKVDVTNPKLPCAGEDTQSRKFPPRAK